MTSSAPSTPVPRTSRSLRAVPVPGPAATPRAPSAPDAVSPHIVAAPRTSATQFSECVRTIVTLARRRGLRPPAFRSPPRIDGVDRSIQRRRNGSVMVAVRRGDRPFAAIQGDVIEGVVAANHLSGEAADRFRRAAWTALEGSGDRVPPTVTDAARSRPAERPVIRVA